MYSTRFIHSKRSARPIFIVLPYFFLNASKRLCLCLKSWFGSYLTLNFPFTDQAIGGFYKVIHSVLYLSAVHFYQGREHCCVLKEVDIKTASDLGEPG